MAHRLGLNTDQVSILTNRVEISRSLNLFSLRDITNGWGISIATLHRYKSPRYREYSRSYARRQYLSARKSLQRGVCHRCSEGLEEHSRCADCTILLHMGYPLCESCAMWREHRRMREYQALIELYA